MILEKFSYKEFAGLPRYWELEEFQLNNINLIVGNNSSGKSRTLNVIYGLSRLLLSPKIQYNNGTYKGSFRNQTSNITYSLELSDGIVLSEEMYENDRLLFSRDQNGEGEIHNNDLGKKTKFKIPINELVACRRDEIQYPYLEHLFNWASNTRHFRFAKEEEKYTLALIDSNKSLTENFNLKESNQAVEIFRIAKSKYKKSYQSMIVEDLKKIGYSISSIDTGVLHSIKVDASMGNKVVGLRVQESDREGLTDQHEMSDGMFRALSILIHYNFYILEKINLNILIDDIGEGLDFDRSTQLINLLIEKSSNSNIQLIMSTNDKFVMNNTKLKYWQIISRKGGFVHMSNIFNSEKQFDEFKFTGLNNFDFFSTDFFKNGFDQ